MPDVSGARALFALDGAQADQYDRTSHEQAFVLAAAATQSVHQLEAELASMLALLEPFFAEKGPDEAHAFLALTAHRLAVFVRALSTGAGASRHPLADGLRQHEDLSSLRGEQLVTRLETWLQSGGGPL